MQVATAQAPPHQQPESGTATVITDNKQQGSVSQSKTKDDRLPPRPGAGRGRWE
jgi:hypothetical protein